MTDQIDDTIMEAVTQVVAEIADGQIDIVRTAQAEDTCVKLLVRSTSDHLDAIDCCSPYSAKLSKVLGVKYITWVDAAADLRHQVAQALGPARIEVANVSLQDDEQHVDVVLESRQMGAAIGRRGSNINAARRLLRVAGFNLIER